MNPEGNRNTPLVLLALLLLAVVLDFLLVRHASRILREHERHGKGPVPQVRIFGVPSTLLSWVVLRWPVWLAFGRSLLGIQNVSKVDKKTVVDSTPPVENLENPPAAPLETGTDAAPPAWIRLVAPLFSLGLVLYLAGMPAWLVFQDRWLGNRDVSTFLSEAWCKSSFLCQTSLPGYFAGVVVYLLLALGLLLLRRDTRLALAPFQPAAVAAQVVKTPDIITRKLSTGLFIAAGAGALVSVLLTLGKAAVFGWGFIYALGCYSAAWMVRANVRDRLSRWVWSNLDFLTASLLAHLAWILFLMDLNAWSPKHWGYGVLLLLAVANLLRFSKRISPSYWIFNLALLPLSYGINSWAYSVIGDDFMFFMRASEIADTYSLWQIGSHLFDGILVYGAHPYLSTILHVIPMKLLGTTNFAWRFSSVYLVALSLPLFYSFLRRFIPQRTAYWFVAFFASSSYLMTFGKIGYNNLQALFGMALVLWSISVFLEKRSELTAVGAGLALGFLFYLYPAAIYVIPVAGLLLLVYDPPTTRGAARRWGILLLSTLAFVLPLMLQPDYWQAKMPGTLYNNPEISGTQAQIFNHIAKNLLLSFLSFLYIPNETHFVVVGYLDLLSAVMVILGLGIALKSAVHNRFMALMLACFGILLFLVGASHDRPFPPTTRMFLMLPMFFLFAAFGFNWLVERLDSLGFMTKSPNALIGMLLVAILTMNLYQAYRLSPQRSLGQQTVEVLFLRVAENLNGMERNSEFPKKIVFLTDSGWGIEGFILLQRVYGFASARLQVDRQALTAPELPSQAVEALSQRNTLVIIQPNLPPDWQANLSGTLATMGKIPCDVKENSGQDTRFVLWHSPDLSQVCQFK